MTAPVTADPVVVTPLSPAKIAVNDPSTIITALANARCAADQTKSTSITCPISEEVMSAWMTCRCCAGIITARPTRWRCGVGARNGTLV